MDILQISAIGIITAICVLILRESKSEMALIVGIAGGCLILLCTIDYFSEIFSVLVTLMNSSAIPSSIYTIIFKIIGIGYIADFSASIVEDASQKALADKITLAGKVIIMSLSLPIIVLLFETIAELVQ